MFDDLLDIFDRDRNDRKDHRKRPGGIRGLIARLSDHDDDRSSRRYGDDDDRSYRRRDDDDDHSYRRRDDDDDRSYRRRDDDDDDRRVVASPRRRRETMDWDD